MKSGIAFKKVGECLYRNPSSGTYFALLKIRGKQKKQSLRTDHLPEARRKLKDLRRDLELTDPQAEMITLVQLADTYIKLITNQAKSTRAGKEGLVARIKDHWPGGAGRLISKVKSSEALEFLANYPGPSRHRQALEVLRSMFKIALNDKLVARSPVDGLTQREADPSDADNLRILGYRGEYPLTKVR